MRNPREILKVFHCFENERAEKIGQFSINGFLAWPIIKSNLCYRYIREKSIPAEQTKPGARENSLFKIARKTLVLIGALGYLGRIYLIKSRKKNSVLFYAKSADKLTKLEGYYFNYLLDGFIREHVVTNFIYAEQSLEGNYRRPYSTTIDLKIDKLFALSFFYKTRARRKELKKTAAAITGEINDYLARTPGMQIREKDVKEILVAFWTEYKISRLLLKALKPAMIITSEKIGTGLFAAAADLKIPAVDLQHGIIDALEPMYQYSARLSPARETMSTSSSSIPAKRLFRSRCSWSSAAAWW